VTTGRIILIVLILIAIIIITMGVAALGGELFGPKQQAQTVSASCNNSFVLFGCNATATMNPFQAAARVDPIIFTAILCLIGAGVLYLVAENSKRGG